MCEKARFDLFFGECADRRSGSGSSRGTAAWTGPARRNWNPLPIIANVEAVRTSTIMINMPHGDDAGTASGSPAWASGTVALTPDGEDSRARLIEQTANSSTNRRAAVIRLGILRSPREASFSYGEKADRVKNFPYLPRFHYNEG